MMECVFGSAIGASGTLIVCRRKGAVRGVGFGNAGEVAPMRVTVYVCVFGGGGGPGPGGIGGRGSKRGPGAAHWKKPGLSRREFKLQGPATNVVTMEQHGACKARSQQWQDSMLRRGPASGCNELQGRVAHD
jgi:hypothetical protein